MIAAVGFDCCWWWWWCCRYCGCLCCCCIVALGIVVLIVVDAIVSVTVAVWLLMIQSSLLFVTQKVDQNLTTVGQGRILRDAVPIRL